MNVVEKGLKRIVKHDIIIFILLSCNIVLFENPIKNNSSYLYFALWTQQIDISLKIY